MARHKNTERKKGDHSAANMLRAVQLHRNGMSLRKAAKECSVHYPTLFRYTKKLQNVSDGNLTAHRLTPNYEVNTIFSEEQEAALNEYIVDCALKFYGLTRKDVRCVAYQMAIVNNIKCPDSWHKEKMAGVEWLRSFRTRHPELSLKKPEACSLARATSFNRDTVKSFFNNLKNVMERHPSFGNGCRVFNLDETATTTVQKPQKVMAPKGRQNIGKVTSGEKGTLVTTCAIVCASGQALPPVLVFPRKNFKDHMLTGAPPGTLGLAAPSGWMNSELFFQVMEHFIKQTSASPENPALLIMDNHESHLSIEALNLAKQSGVVILTLHPHTTAKMQPLDVGLNGPFKIYYNSAVDSWLMRNPGKPLTIYNVAECVGQAYAKAMTPVNIASAFKKCGIYPYDPDVFNDLDFMPSAVTDRDQPSSTSSALLAPTVPDNRQSALLASASPGNEMAASAASGHQQIETVAFDGPGNLQTETENRSSPESDVTYCTESPSMIEENQAIISNSKLRNALSPSLLQTDQPDDEPIVVAEVSAQATSSACEASNAERILENIDSNANHQAPTSPVASTSGIQNKFKSPKEFMPPLKAGPRTGRRKPRKLGKSMVATDTPEKNQIAAEREKTKERKSAAKKIKRPILSNEKKKPPKKKGKTVKPSKSDSETSTEEDEIVELLSESELDDIESEDDPDDDELPMITESFSKMDCKPKVNDYVLVSFVTKKLKVYYVALITEVISANTFGASFMRLKAKDTMKFRMPLEPDLSEIHVRDIKMILPPPQITGTKKRNSAYIFPVRISTKINLR